MKTECSYVTYGSTFTNKFVTEKQLSVHVITINMIFLVPDA